MQTQTEGQEHSSGCSHVLATLRQTAQPAADAAVDAVRTQANGVLDGYRDELKRAIGVYTLYRAALLFMWSAAAMLTVTLELISWDSHRVAASLAAAGGFLVFTAVAALRVTHLTRRSR